MIWERERVWEALGFIPVWDSSQFGIHPSLGTQHSHKSAGYLPIYYPYITHTACYIKHGIRTSWKIRSWRRGRTLVVWKVSSNIHTFERVWRSSALWAHHALDLAVHFPGCELLCGLWPRALARAGRFGRFQYLNPSQTLYIVDVCPQISQNPCRDGVGTRYATPCTAHMSDGIEKGAKLPYPGPNLTEIWQDESGS